MKVRIVEWCEYVPDCPADLEVTYNTVLGVYAVNDDVDAKVAWTIGRYKRDRIKADYLGTTEGHFKFRAEHLEYGGPLDDKAKAMAIARAEKERLEAESDFEDYYNGFFNHNDYELDRYVRPYILEETTT